MTTIHKIIRRESGFTMISNELARDVELSFQARGILVMVLSHSESWITTHGWIESQSKKNGREAIRTALEELVTSGHLTESVQRHKGRIVGRSMTWHEKPIAPELRWTPPDDQKTGSRHTVKPPKDGNPTCGLPAPSEYNREQKKIIKKGNFPIGCEPANAIELDLTTPEEIKRLWKVYQDYRTERHHMKGGDRLAWTEAAAKMAAEAINRHVLTHGEQMVADRIRIAVEKGWNGLNMDTLGKPYESSQHGKKNQSTPGGKFSVFQDSKAGEFGPEFSGKIG